MILKASNSCFPKFMSSVLTPYYKEDVLYSEEELNKENEDGITILFYLQRIYPGKLLSGAFVRVYNKFLSLLNENDCITEEWSNYCERVTDSKRNLSEKDKAEQLRQWVSYRGQTLSRTGILSERFRIYLYSTSVIANVFSSLILLVRGMMYYRMALELQCFQEYTGENGWFFLSTLSIKCFNLRHFVVWPFSA